ncbi:MAG: AEC family transporter [Proteobacteria bacterium]|nr:AEC family transporter [Pseudomonadota bacterium]
MLESFLTVFPIFALILIGWAAIRTGLVREETGNGVADYVFMIAIPLMLFRTLATAPLPASPPWAFWASYFISLGLIWVAQTRIASHTFTRGQQESAIIGFTAVQSNMVLMGIPMVLRVFGDAGAIPLFLLVAVNLPITMTLAMLRIESTGASGSVGLTILKKLATNPILIGIFVGAAFRQTGLSIPAPALATLKFIGDSAAPCALFAMGAGLARYGLGGETWLLAIVVALKLLVFPILVFSLGTFVLGIDPLWVGVATVLAACPCGVNAYLLAERYRLAQGITSGAILISSVFAVATTTLFVWLVTAR